MTINNRFGALLAQKIAREKRKITMTEVEEKTGVMRKTLQAWANNTVTRFDAHVLDALCQYFSCQPGDLLTYEAPAGAAFEFWENKEDAAYDGL